MAVWAVRVSCQRDDPPVLVSYSLKVTLYDPSGTALPVESVRIP
jgi:hypothetical protein